MAIEKAPENKAISPIDPIYTEGEQTMPEAVDDQRNQICAVQGHSFNEAIQAMINDSASYVDQIPERSLCHRCGLEITLADIIEE